MGWYMDLAVDVKTEAGPYWVNIQQPRLAWMNAAYSRM
jgi:hypothetical protein